MTEQELREKIAKHVCYACEMGLGDGDCAECSDYRKCGVCLDVADAIIAEGIGDVSEWKDKATASELVAQAAANTAIERIEEWKHRVESYKNALKGLARQYCLLRGYKTNQVNFDVDGETIQIILNDELEEERKDE